MVPCMFEHCTIYDNYDFHFVQKIHLMNSIIDCVCVFTTNRAFKDIHYISFEKKVKDQINDKTLILIPFCVNFILIQKVTKY